MKGTHRKVAVGLALSAMLLLGLGPRPATAQVREVQGHAYGAFVKAGLFGGQPNQVGAAPMVELPANGGNETKTLPSLAAQFGPAVIFGGIWPDNVATGPPSGPLTVKTEGRPGPGGFVTSSADIVLHPRPVEVRCAGGQNPPCTAPGGIGPSPLIADEAHSTCTANESGLTGSARFVNGKVETSTDPATQLPKTTVPIPPNPAPNTVIEGTIDHVGDRFRIVLNEQIVEGQTITVRAAHMYLLGNIAVGDAIVGQSVCGLSAAKVSTAPPTTAPSATASTAPAATAPPDSELRAEATGSDSGGGNAALVIGAVAGVAALGAGLFALKRRRRQPA